MILFTKWKQKKIELVARPGMEQVGMGGFQTRRPPRQHFEGGDGGGQGGFGSGGNGEPPEKRGNFNRMFGGHGYGGGFSGRGGGGESYSTEFQRCLNLVDCRDLVDYFCCLNRRQKWSNHIIVMILFSEPFCSDRYIPLNRDITV